MTPGTTGDASATAIRAAVAPYAWRRFTPEFLARLALAAGDRHRLESGLTHLPGAAVGRWAPLAPVARDDPRVLPLVVFLGDQRWTALGLTALCGRLAAAVR